MRSFSKWTFSTTEKGGEAAPGMFAMGFCSFS